MLLPVSVERLRQIESELGKKMNKLSVNPQKVRNFLIQTNGCLSDEGILFFSQTLDIPLEELETYTFVEQYWFFLILKIFELEASTNSMQEDIRKSNHAPYPLLEKYFHYLVIHPEYKLATPPQLAERLRISKTEFEQWIKEKIVNRAERVKKYL